MKKLMLTAAAVALVLAGCSGSDRQSSQSNGGVHNQADEAFALQMIDHHKGALEMTRMVPERTQTPAITDLARRIDATQQPEIDQMSKWLDDWNVDRGSGDSMVHMQGDGMARLMTLRGTEFDRLFLQEMITHHEGAVAMSETELRDGQSQEAKDLARRIIDSQKAEIDEMRRLLAQGG